MESGTERPTGTAIRARRAVWRFARLLSLSALLTACVTSGDILRTDSLQKRMATTQYRMVDVSRSWVFVPGGLLALERDLGGVQEQRIALPNQSVLSGDNFVLLRARGAGALSGGRFNLDSFLSAAGGAPYPFENLTNRNMKTGADALGSYFWTERPVGASTVCVLAVRSLDRAARPLPRKAKAVDVMLRNCVAGSAADALLPILAQNIGALPTPGMTPNGPLRNLSPFAAPVRN